MFSVTVMVLRVSENTHSKGRGGADRQIRPMRADQADPFPTEAEGGQHYVGKKLQIG